jgi:hypothetical protein
LILEAGSPVRDDRGTAVVTGDLPSQPVPGAGIVAAQLRRRAEAVRAVVFSGHRNSFSRPELAEELSRRLVAALLAPVFAALDGSRGRERITEFAEAAWYLFELAPGDRP